MTDHEFIIDMQARCAAQLGAVVVDPPIKPVDPPPVVTPPAGVVMIDAPVPGGPAHRIARSANTIYCFVWPAGGGFMYVETQSGGTPILIGAAPTAGDMAYAKAHGYYSDQPGIGGIAKPIITGTLYGFFELGADDTAIVTLTLP